MTKRVSLKDVASALGLAPSTVSRALSSDDSTHVSPALRERVRAMCAAMGYHPNQTARRLRTGRTDTIGLLVYEQYNLFFQWVTSQVHAVVADRGLGLVVDTAEHRATRLDRTWMAADWAVDGVIAYDVGHAYPEELRRLRERGLPVVVVGPVAPPEFDHVAADIAGGARLAMRHLLELGRRRIGYVLPEQAVGLDEPRNVVYAETMGEAGLQPLVMAIPGTECRHAVRRYLGDFVRAGRRLPEAIFCRNDEYAIGCLRGLTDLGVRVPDDVAVIGFDGIEDSAFTCPDLSTVVQPVTDLCRLAADLLQRRRDLPEAPIEHRVLPCQLAARESTLGRQT
ncbi:MAG: LacI family DNA-binding transcriptional regulator [Armatimonadetes bacterium]|nr:LacI family DNA-binding transcriptional regulator [Armatimonadota bacterium]